MISLSIKSISIPKALALGGRLSGDFRGSKDKPVAYVRLVAPVT